jgi:mycothiol synthase
VPFDVGDHLDGPLRSAVDALLTRAEHADGRPALSDHLRIDVRNGGGDGFLAVTYRLDGSDEVLGYAQASAANEALAMEMVVDPRHRTVFDDIGGTLLDALTAGVARRGGSMINWWIHGDADMVALASRAGFAEDRRLLQMRRSLPADRSADVDTRPFDVGRDEDEWVLVNNRAFAGHGEQGGWTTDALRRREGERWFDPTGFRIHERDGRMAAFCWTKVHQPTEYESTRIGEIYVIAVDPDFHGLGLGSQLTLAGLDHLTALGIETGMLYVDAANEAAVAMYERLGFETATVSTAHHLEIAGLERVGET